jgi:hypothetical protein
MDTLEEELLPAEEELPLSTTDSKYVNLPRGKALSIADASHIVRSTGAPIVLLVGAAESGKTTLIASLHDCFQWSTFNNYHFAGSDTLIGFEERCFDSRKVSGAREPATIRTNKADGIQLYHLKLRSNLKTPIRNLLLADLSGETYEEAVNSAQAMRELFIITRADHFVLLVDGEKLQTIETQAYTRTNILLLMRRCFEQNMLKANARVDVLLTKWDIVLKQTSQADANKLLSDFKGLVEKEWGAKLGRLNIQQIAARPHYSSNLPLCYGLDQVFSRWVEEPSIIMKPIQKQMPTPLLTRMFDRYRIF